MIKVFITATLEKFMNRLLQLDPQTVKRLAAFADKVVLIKIPTWKIHLYLLITTQGLQLLNNYEGHVDTIIEGSALALLRSSKSKVTQLENVQIEGDIELGQQIRDIIRGMDIDWEEQLSKATGDVIAHQVGAAARGVLNWLKSSSQNLQQDFSEYMQEEARLLPTRAEVEEFIAGVSEIRHDVERLEARINLLD